MRYQEVFKKHIFFRVAGWPPLSCGGTPGFSSPDRQAGFLLGSVCPRLQAGASRTMQLPGSCDIAGEKAASAEDVPLRGTWGQCGQCQAEGRGWCCGSMVPYLQQGPPRGRGFICDVFGAVGHSLRCAQGCDPGCDPASGLLLWGLGHVACVRVTVQPGVHACPRGATWLPRHWISTGSYRI